MLSPTINVKVINVELTNERHQQIIKSLAPTMRLLANGRSVACDVVIRKIHRSWGSDIFCISVRLSSRDKTYYAIANNTHFLRAVNRANDRLRRAMSKVYYTKTEEVRQMQQMEHEKYFTELFV